MIRVMIVDDHELVREGIKRLLADVDGIDVIAEAADGESAVKLARQDTPDVVLLDVNMPGMGGLEATKKLQRIDANLKILAVSAHSDEPYPSRVLQAGANGYVTKGAEVDEMVKAIKLVHTGKRYISPEVAQQLALKHLSDEGDSPFDLLSEREMQVMIMITSGQRVNDISEQLHLSPKTVNSYRYRIFEKLNVNSDVELTHLAIKHKLIDTL